MRVHTHIPIGEIAASLPHVTRLLDVIGVDYVLHGNLSLRDACAEAGVDPSMVRKSIESLPHDELAHNWADASMDELLVELRDRRHPKMRVMLADTATLLAELPAGEAGLGPLREAFAALCNELGPHLTREEHMLFPVVQHLEDCWTRNEHLAMNFVGGIGRPVATLFSDHVQLIDRLNRVRGAAMKIDDDDATRSRVLDAITDLEHELREHIHLENNVLYPRATALESALRGTPTLSDV